MNVIRKLKALRLEANLILNEAIETEMRRVIKRRGIGLVCKGMGVILVGDIEQNLFDVYGEYADKPPKYCDRLFELIRMDSEYFSLTGYPLRISKKSGIITETRSWG